MKIEPLPYLKKRNLLNDPNPDPQRMKRIGDLYFDMDLLQDALLFYEKAGDQKALEMILSRAMDEGDLFLVKQVIKILKRELSKEEWIRLAMVAEKKGKFFFALEAYREAGEQDEAGRLSITTATLLNGPPQSLDTPERGA
ncbi:MAG: hypothetical protein N2260_00820 [Syntrophobacterales bacterium]|nr:hypothetical protein [Syntrophobacterales bacterium]